MAHVAQYKKDIVSNIKRLGKKHTMVGSVNMESLPTPQLQKMRAQLRGKVVIYMAKRRLINIALEELKKEKPGIEKLESHLKGMPALIFTEDNPFSLYQTLQKNKSPAPAKAGQVAPKDIVVPAGPTPFAPGPIISELGNCGIKAGIENGKVAVKEDAVVVKEGEEISEEMASILTRLGIEPMEIGLDLVATFEDGEIITKEVLSIDPQEYIDNVTRLAQESFALATEVGYLCEETVLPMVTKNERDARAVSIEMAYPTKETMPNIIGKAEAQANAVNSIASTE